MPNGITHDKEATIAAVASCVLATVLSKDISIGTQVLVGGLSAVLITPDLDLDAGCRAFENMEHLAGKPARIIWRAFWFPYARAVGHRSWISHTPLISTFIRLAYLLSPVYLVWWLSAPETLVSPLHLTWVFVGLTLSDLVHIIHDRI